MSRTEQQKKLQNTLDACIKFGNMKSFPKYRRREFMMIAMDTNLELWNYSFINDAEYDENFKKIDKIRV